MSSGNLPRIQMPRLLIEIYIWKSLPFPPHPWLKTNDWELVPLVPTSKGMEIASSQEQILSSGDILTHLSFNKGLMNKMKVTISFPFPRRLPQANRGCMSPILPLDCWEEKSMEPEISPHFKAGFRPALALGCIYSKGSGFFKKGFGDQDRTVIA